MSSDDSSPKSESLHCSEGVISLNDCGLVGGVSDTDTVRATGAVDIDAGGDNEHAVVGVAENGEYGIAIGLAVTSRKKSSLTVRCQQCSGVEKRRENNLTLGFAERDCNLVPFLGKAWRYCELLQWIWDGRAGSIGPNGHEPG